MSFPKMYRMLLVASVLVTLTACSKSPGENATQATAPTAATSTTVAPSSSAAVNASSLSSAELGAATSSVAHCSLDTINSVGFINGATQATVKTDSVFTAGGWLVDGAMQSPATFTLVLEGTESFGFAATTGISRPDVAKAMGAETAGQSGFNTSANLGTTPAGTYKVLALIKGTNGTELCDTTRQLVIGD